MNDRIKLAEAMGWKKCGILNEKPYGHDHSGPTGDCLGAFELPDPFTDANDCEALVQWLNECDSGYQVEVTFNFSSIGHFVKLRSTAAGTIGEWQGEDWKQGVCELALKVLQ